MVIFFFFFGESGLVVCLMDFGYKRTSRAREEVSTRPHGTLRNGQFFRIVVFK